MKYIILIGNDCTGKTSLVKQINKQSDNSYYAFERSTINKFSNVYHQIDFKSIDNLTLLTTISDEYCNYEFTDVIDGSQVYYIVIDADINVLLKRAEKRIGEAKGIFESKKSLEYFRKRFLAMASYFGFPVVQNNGNISLEDKIEEIIKLINSSKYEQVKNLALKDLTHEKINSLLLENIYNNNNNDKLIKEVEKIIINDPFLKQIYCDLPLFNSEIDCTLFLDSLVKRHFADTSDKNSLIKNNELYLRLVTEGESKRVYEIISNNEYLNFYVIALKPTIYSHSKQACGEIKNLEKTRASGTQLILEMLWRNNINHTYYAMNNKGIAHSKIIETTPIEVVFKKYCIGTDKHSYYKMLVDSNCVLNTGEYVGGPYIRFDWRNPNQISTDGTQLNTNPFYYIFESFIGKEKFFEKYLKHQKSWGDKAISEDIIHSIFDTKECKKIILKIYCTIQYYCNQVGLEVKDGCFMIDKYSKYVWSEINPDCMRIVSKSDGTQYDKDIWRAQMNNSKDNVIKQWDSFNKIFSSYFDENKYIETELSYQEINKYKFQYQVREILDDKRLNVSSEYKEIYNSFFPRSKRDVVFTLDIYDKQPVLVKKGKIIETHSNGDITEAINKISIAPNIFIADLNGAINGDNKTNRDLVKDIATKYHIYTGGGIRSLNDVQDLLSASCRRVTISSNLDEDFIKKISKNRLIVELAVNENNKLLTYGRNVTTDIDILDKIDELVKLDIQSISITFNNSEGMLNGLPREQITNLISQIPNQINNIFIAGGISSINDLNFLWSFERVIPQLGSVIWKNILTVGDVMSEMARYDEKGLIPAIVQNTANKTLGLVWMNKQAIKNTFDNKEFWRYSRQSNKLIMKGEESGNTQEVVQLSFDCDNDSLLVIVKSENSFCHLKSGDKHCLSCFSVQQHKFNNEIVNKWITKSNSKYTSLMKKFPGMSYSKLLEEIGELWASKDTNDKQKHLTNEASDVYIHFLMFLNSLGITQENIMNELGRRHYDPKLIETESHKTYDNVDNNIFVIGITGDKYSSYTDNFILKNLGMKIIRGTGKDLSINYEIVDQSKYDTLFGNKKVTFIGLKPKDMTVSVIYKLLHATISYNTVLDNLPTVFNKLIEVSENDISLCLIKNKLKVVNPLLWTPLNKGKVACEHMSSVTQYFTKMGISPNCYSLHKFSGSSESFLVNKTAVDYDLCDAVVSSGKTLEENNLEIYDTILKPEEVMIVYAEIIKI